MPAVPEVPSPSTNSCWSQQRQCQQCQQCPARRTLEVCVRVVEQHHANLWCRALLDFVDTYPEVVERVRLPGWYLRIMLRSIGKPHDVLGFTVDCLAFEVVMPVGAAVSKVGAVQAFGAVVHQ